MSDSKANGASVEKRFGMVIRFPNVPRAGDVVNDEAMMRAFAVSQHWEIVEVYYLVSSFDVRSVGNEDEKKRILQDVRDGRIEGVIVSRVLDFGRSAADFMTLVKELAMHNALLYSMKEKFDMSTPWGEMFLSISKEILEWKEEHADANISRDLAGEADLNPN